MCIHIFAGSLCKSMCIYRNRSNGCPMFLSMFSKLAMRWPFHIYRAGSAAPLQSQRSRGKLINVPLGLGADWAASAAFWFWVRVSTLVKVSVLVKVVSSSPLFAAIILLHPALSHWIIGTSAATWSFDDLTACCDWKGPLLQFQLWIWKAPTEIQHGTSWHTGRTAPNGPKRPQTARLETPRAAKSSAYTAQETSGRTGDNMWEGHSAEVVRNPGW